MNVLSHRHVNLHSASTQGGLIHIPAGVSKTVPDDVADHPGFDLLLKSGQIVKLANPAPEPEPEPEKKPDPKAKPATTAAKETK